jgi:FSR family fosmidomycin resistance protein-like MFS transporter
MDKTLSTDTPITAPPAVDNPTTTTYPVIAAISFSHLLNDMMQSVLLAIYPLLKLGLDLSFTQIGLITLTYQFTASLLQPLIGLYTDRRPMPYSLPLGMGFTLVGCSTCRRQAALAPCCCRPC